MRHVTRLCRPLATTPAYAAARAGVLSGRDVFGPEAGGRDCPGAGPPAAPGQADRFFLSSSTSSNSASTTPSSAPGPPVGPPAGPPVGPPASPPSPCWALYMASPSFIDAWASASVLA